MFATFFSQVMAAIGGNTAGPGDAVVNVYINHEKKFDFVEMRSVEEASNAMALDGIIFEGAPVKVRRFSDYNPSFAATLGPSQPNPNLNLGAVGLTPGSAGGLEGPDRIFVGGLPYYFTKVQVKGLLESFGPLRGFDLVKDRETGNSKGYAFCVYQDLSVMDIACAALNGIKMGNKTLTVRRANQGANQPKPEQESVLLHAQQQIALQKLMYQLGALATKVVCLTQVVTEDELKDDGEYEDILEDMRQEGGKFGNLVNVAIPRPRPDGEPSAGVGKVILPPAMGNALLPPQVQVAITFDHQTDAIAIVAGEPTNMEQSEIGHVSSDLVRIPCAPFNCILCEGKPNPNPNRHNPVVALNLSSTCMRGRSLFSLLLRPLRCCLLPPLSPTKSPDCASFSCPSFYYADGDGSFIATLYRLSISIPTSPPALVLRNFTFGCAHSALGEPGGRRKRLATTRQSSCSRDARQPGASVLLLRRAAGDIRGREAYSGGGEIEGSGRPREWQNGGRLGDDGPVRLVDGHGNQTRSLLSVHEVVVLPAGLYGSVVAKFERRLGQVHKQAREIEDKTGLSPCYYFDDDAMTGVPTVTLHFVGQRSSVVLPRRNYLYDFMDGSNGSRRRSRVGRLMLMNGGDEAEAEGRPEAIMGNYRQRGFEVVYDLEKRRVGFCPTALRVPVEQPQPTLDTRLH
ncbi:hypothetical protein NL676_039681 [Syzygium grande]|nr:hypothetical protein NL676_039681 [Syzygium grande]